MRIPLEILDQADKYKKSCLWVGGDINEKGGCVVAWQNAFRSKEKGGLGITDPRTQNSTLLLKFLHKFCNRVDLPWL